MAGLFDDVGGWFQGESAYPGVNRAQYFGAMMDDLAGLMQSGPLTGPHKSTFSRDLHAMAAPQMTPFQQAQVDRWAAEDAKPDPADKIWEVKESDGRLYRYNKVTGEAEWLDGQEAPTGPTAMTATEYKERYGYTPTKDQLAVYNDAVLSGDKKKIADVSQKIRTDRNDRVETMSKEFARRTDYLTKVIAIGEAAVDRLDNPATTGPQQIETLYDFIGAIAKDDSAKREGELVLGQSAQSAMSQLQVLIERYKGSGSKVLSPELAREMNRIVLNLSRKAQATRRNALANFQERAAAAGANADLVGKKRPDIRTPRDYAEVENERKRLQAALKNDTVKEGQILVDPKSKRMYRRVPGADGFEYIGIEGQEQ